MAMVDNNVGDNMLVDSRPTESKEGNIIPSGFDINYLKIYYGQLFPYEELYKWMSYGHDGRHPGCDPTFIGRREFVFTLEDDIYLRYQSFSSMSDLENAVKDKCPHKIDIGPVYSVDPSKRSAYAQSGNTAFVPVERELIFDIDISDYDDVRYCCSGADVCLDCWPLMTIAIKVINATLRDDFGFQHILWVYSGRRGVHCWVCDQKARRLTNDQRASIAEYFRVNKGNENNQRKVSLGGPSLHPFLARSYADVLKVYFEEELLSRQNLFTHEERFRPILEMIPDETVANQLLDSWKQSKLSTNDLVRWEQLKNAVQSSKRKVHGLRRCVEEIVFCYTYPRLDMEVSKKMNHLLKSPFCVHPKTGRVCIPIDPDQCENFDPTSVPTLSGLLNELNTRGRTTDHANGWEGTSLAESIRFYHDSFLQPLLKSCKTEIESSYSAKIQESKDGLSW